MPSPGESENCYFSLKGKGGLFTTGTIASAPLAERYAGEAGGHRANSWTESLTWITRRGPALRESPTPGWDQ